MSASFLSIAAAVASGCVASAALPPADSSHARIGVERGEAYLVTALYDGVADEQLAYRLEVVREGAAGRSQSAQGGAFSSGAGRTDSLSTLRVSVAPGDQFRARLVILRGEEVVSEVFMEETVR